MFKKNIYKWYVKGVLRSKRMNFCAIELATSSRERQRSWRVRLLYNVVYSVKRTLKAMICQFIEVVKLICGV